MTLIAPKQQNDRILAEAGTHLATCVGLIQIGTVETEYMGEKKWVDKIRLTFELPEELHEFKEGDGKKPLVVSQGYTHSMGSKSNLRPIVEGILGVALLDEEAYAFDIEQLLGKSCLLTLAHRESKAGSKYVFIQSASPLMKSMSKPVQINENKLLTYTNWKQEYFETLPNFIKDEMKGSKQYIAKFGITKDTFDDIKPEEIPF